MNSPFFACYSDELLERRVVLDLGAPPRPKTVSVSY